jgi:mono/diheme cytochrome c family protein
MGLIGHFTNNLGEQVVRLTMTKFRANVRPTLIIGAALGTLLFSASGGGSVLAADLPEGFKAGELAPAPPADMIEAGKRVYFTKCVWCHGVDGAGDGPGADRLWPRPRNFNQGTFKIRHTASGELPLFNVN